MKFILFCIIGFTVLTTLSGCSALSFLHYYKQSQPVTWRVMTEEEDTVMAYEYHCDSLTIKTKQVWRGIGDWRIFGPPILPLFPVDLFNSPSHNLSLIFEVKPPADSLRRSLKIGIQLDSTNTLISPENAYSEEIVEDLLKRKGYYYRSQRPGSFRLVYIFKIDQFPERFTVHFLEPYLGCNIPDITYVAESSVKYAPLLLPEPIGD